MIVVATWPLMLKSRRPSATGAGCRDDHDADSAGACDRAAGGGDPNDRGHVNTIGTWIKTLSEFQVPAPPAWLAGLPSWATTRPGCGRKWRPKA